MGPAGIRVGRIFSIPIYLHPSWFLIFALITFTLATQFTSLHPQWSHGQHWTVGLITSLLFFSSVLLHELGHSVVALRYRIPVLSITLFVFGGLARIGREARRPWQEFAIAVAGPVTSLLLAALFFLLARPFAPDSVVGAMSGWLGEINLLLALFNLVPGFPLDGGRILRSIVWAATGDFNRATQWASRSGQFIAYLLILIGIVAAVVAGHWLNGLWYVFIGWFLLTAAQESAAQAVVRRVLEGLRAADVMSGELPTVPRGLSLLDYLHEALRTGRSCHLVMNDSDLAGIITLADIARFPREAWATTSVQAAMRPPEATLWVSSEEPALRLLERMLESDLAQMPVMDHGRVVGVVSRDALLRLIQTRLQFAHLAEP